MTLNQLHQKKQYLQDSIIFLKADIKELQKDDFNDEEIERTFGIIDFTLFEIRKINDKIKIFQNSIDKKICRRV